MNVIQLQNLHFREYSLALHSLQDHNKWRIVMSSKQQNNRKTGAYRNKTLVYGGDKVEGPRA